MTEKSEIEEYDVRCTYCNSEFTVKYYEGVPPEMRWWCETCGGLRRITRAEP